MPTASFRPPVRPEAHVTLRDLLSVPAFGLRLVAAPDEVDRPVRWAHSTDLVDPRPYLSGQELVLTVGASLTDDDRCREFVDHLVEAGASGLGYGVGDVTAGIPVALVEDCRERGFPLLEVPLGVPFQGITEMLAESRTEARTARTRRIQLLVVRLLEVVAQGGTIPQLCAMVEDELGGRVGFRDGVLDWAPLDDADVRPTDDTLAHLARVLDVRQREEDSDQANRRREVGRLVELVLHGRADAEVLHHPLLSAGVPADGLLVPVAWPRRAWDLVGHLLPECLCAEFGEVTLTLGRDSEHVLEVARQAALPCGVGDAALLPELAQALGPALAALKLARNRGAAVTTGELTSFEGLLEQQPPERLLPFAQSLILPLFEHDQAHGTALVSTLRAFLDVDGSTKTTAERLFLHPNSLRQRLKRVHDLSGADPRSFEDRVALAVGLWAWERRPRGRSGSR